MKSAEKKTQIIRYIIAGFISVVALLAVEAMFLITTRVPDLSTETIDAVQATVETAIESDIDAVANTVAEDVSNSTLLSDFDSSEFEAMLKNKMTQDTSIEYEIKGIDTKRKSALVTFKVTSTKFDGYGDKVAEAIEKDLKDIITGVVRDESTSIFDGDISAENLDDTASDTLIEENGVNDELGSTYSSSDVTNKYLSEPMDTLEKVEIQEVLEFNFDSKSHSWVVNQESLNSLLTSISDIIGAGLNNEVDKLIVYTNGISLQSIFSNEEYVEIINSIINDKLETLEDIDYSSFIDKVLADIKQENTDVQ